MDIRWRVLLSVTALKLLLIPAYHSTDFEVHRNWLAITASLPISQWYTDTTSQWTLDYPPFFAWFEFLLSRFSGFFDPAMLVLKNLDYASEKTILFQRLTVIATESVLIGGAAYALSPRATGLSLQRSQLGFILVIGHAGLIIVDHMHFQYNGMLLGIFLLSVALIGRGADIAGAFVFAVLLNMKHLFACAAPLYFIYLLRHHCRGPGGILRFLKLGALVAGVCLISFGPFIWIGQMHQVLSRLFPFARGLLHAYWAPNAWALYAAADKALSVLLPRFGFPVASIEGTLTGGLVGVASFAVLPQIQPAHTAVLVVAAMTPALVRAWRCPKPAEFLDAVTYACLCSFVFGYHVHEKAILMVTVLMAAGAQRDRRAAGDFLFLSTAGNHCLMPLIFTAAEYPIKVLMVIIYALGSVVLINEALPGDSPLLRSRIEFVYLLGLAPLELYCTFGHSLLMGKRFPFVPLILTSVYCALGVFYAWALQFRQYIGLAFASPGVIQGGTTKKQR